MGGGGAILSRETNYMDDFYIFLRRCVLQTFQNIAYQADSRQDLLDAINDYLDDSIVLPPGNWDKNTLLPVMEMARKRALRKEKSKKKEDEIKSNYEMFTLFMSI